ncbi:YacL family protein [Thalassotalea ponticola]|uniref:YacL family protein n=1 Tax=Thalassotalea ponticola TaxID=1523392 RepID=UPI0025B5DBCF|nr:YacL family protein [Thalassotalea ponticola]MDN3653592.1 YacL family protein [Thalassotalea ponticola]
MDYQFTLDFITASPRAEFSLEHQIIGPWLESEIGNDSNKLADVFQFITEHEMDTAKQLLTGKEFSLAIEDGEITIFANATDSDATLPEQLLADVDDFDMAQIASCGIEDFVEMLHAWQAFI